MKHKTARPAVTTRSEKPILGRDAKGKPALLCPFCDPSHPLYPGQMHACGTQLKFEAVQAVVRSKFNHQTLVCAKCGKGGGKMVPFGNAYIHAHDCTPGAAMLTGSHFSKLAEYIVKLPKPFQDFLASRIGRAYPVQEVLPDGSRTGKVLGYVLQKEARNGKND